MRVFLSGLVVVMATTFAGCGGGPCSGDLDGDWNGDSSPGKLSLGGSCVFKYQSPGAPGNASTGCVIAGTYGGPLKHTSQANPGTFAVTIADASGSTEGLCLTVGESTLRYHNSETTLTLINAAGSFSFKR